jgi:hypothetical protein
MIHIFYRHYNIETTDDKGRPKWFNFQKCFENLLNTIEGNDVQLHVVMDGDINSNFISKYKDSFIGHEIKVGNDQSSFFQTWEIVKNTQMEKK